RRQSGDPHVATPEPDGRANCRRADARNDDAAEPEEQAGGVREDDEEDERHGGSMERPRAARQAPMVGLPRTGVGGPGKPPGGWRGLSDTRRIASKTMTVISVRAASVASATRVTAAPTPSCCT